MKMKNQAKGWEKIFAKHTSDNELFFKIYKFNNNFKKQPIF